MIFPLNDPQRRHLGVALDRVDAALLVVISSAGGNVGPDAAQLPLSPEQRDIPAYVVPRVLAGALALRSRLGADPVRLEVRRISESARRRAAAYLTSAVVLLEDCHARAMTAYGEVDPALAGLLDPWLRDLEDEVDALRRLLTIEADDGAAR